MPDLRMGVYRKQSAVEQSVDLVVAYSIGTISVVIACVVIFRRWKSSRVCHHEFRLEGVVPDGSIVEICDACMSRQVFVCKEGEEIKKYVVSSDEWIKLHGEIQPQIDERSAARFGRVGDSDTARE